MVRVGRVLVLGALFLTRCGLTVRLEDSTLWPFSLVQGQAGMFEVCNY